MRRVVLCIFVNKNNSKKNLLRMELTEINFEEVKFLGFINKLQKIKEKSFIVIKYFVNEHL